jgi:hypothetical protein
MIPLLFGKQEVGIWWVQKCFPRYGVPIWNLWPNIRSLPSIVADKNVLYVPISWEAFLDPSDSYFLFVDLVGFYTHWTFVLLRTFLSATIDGRDLIFGHKFHIGTPYRNLTGPKTLPMIWVHIWSLWPNIRFLPSIVAEKNVHIFNVYKNQLSRQTGSRNLMGPKTLPTIAHFSSHFPQQLLMSEIWYLVTSFI